MSEGKGGKWESNGGKWTQMEHPSTIGSWGMTPSLPCKREMFPFEKNGPNYDRITLET